MQLTRAIGDWLCMFLVPCISGLVPMVLVEPRPGFPGKVNQMKNGHMQCVLVYCTTSVQGEVARASFYSIYMF